MHIDWNMIIALAAIVTAGILVWQTRYTVSTQTLLQLLAFWQSAPMYPRIRGAAANTTLTILTKKREGETASDINMAHIDDVLDFFETVAFLTKRHCIHPTRVLNFKTKYNIFFDPTENYLVLHKDHIRTTQRKGGQLVWKEYSDLMQRLFTEEKEPSLEEARHFIENERFRCF